MFNFLKKETQKCALESAEAVALIKWASLHPVCKDFLIAIPNGGYRTAREAKSLKKQGVKSGVSDYFLPVPVADAKAHQDCLVNEYFLSDPSATTQKYYGLWIELKRSNRNLSKISKAQQKWITKMRERGYAAEIAYGAEQAINIIKTYLKGEYQIDTTGALNAKSR